MGIKTLLVLFLFSLGLGFALPDRLTLTGVQLAGPLPTKTPYLEYTWHEATYDGATVVFCVLMDTEQDRPIIGFIHYMTKDLEGRLFCAAKYFAWLDGGGIVRLGGKEIAEAYVERHKAQRRRSNE